MYACQLDMSNNVIVIDTEPAHVNTRYSYFSSANSSLLLKELTSADKGLNFTESQLQNVPVQCMAVADVPADKQFEIRVIGLDGVPQVYIYFAVCLCMKRVLCSLK